MLRTNAPPFDGVDHSSHPSLKSLKSLKLPHAMHKAIDGSNKDEDDDPRLAALTKEHQHVQRVEHDYAERSTQLHSAIEFSGDWTVRTMPMSLTFLFLDLIVAIVPAAANGSRRRKKIDRHCNGTITMSLLLLMLLAPIAIVDATCSKGFYDSNPSGTCTECPTGQYQWHDVFTGTACEFCTAGKAFTATTTACSTCIDGKYQDQSTAASVICLTCDAGTFTTAKELSCTRYDCYFFYFFIFFLDNFWTIFFFLLTIRNIFVLFFFFF